MNLSSSFRLLAQLVRKGTQLAYSVLMIVVHRMTVTGRVVKDVHGGQPYAIESRDQSYIVGEVMLLHCIGVMDVPRVAYSCARRNQIFFGELDPMQASFAVFNSTIITHQGIPRVLDLSFASDHTLWLCGLNQVAIIRVGEEEIETVPIRVDCQIRGIEVDTDGCVWLSTAMFVVRYKGYVLVECGDAAVDLLGQGGQCLEPSGKVRQHSSVTAM